MEKLKSLWTQFTNRPQTKNFVGYLKDGYEDCMSYIKAKNIFSVYILFSIFGLSFIDALKLQAPPLLQFIYFVIQVLISFGLEIIIFAGFNFYMKR